MEFGPVIPILRIYDEAKAREFYQGFLGFGFDWEHRFEPELPLYAQISRGNCVLHLSEHHGDVSPGSAVRIGMPDIDTFHAEIMSKGYKYMRPGIEKMPWGSREMTVRDPFFNRIVFYAPEKAA
jgi:uncharacterized glyoxalase superfamily protein PhnB